MELKFERGGTLPKKLSKSFNSSAYGSSNVEKEKAKKPSKREPKKKGSNANEDGFEMRSAKQITLNTLVPDMILMTTVKSIHHTHLLLSLPGRLVGRVPITHVSNSYSNAIKTALEDEHGEEDLSEKPKGLSEMFKVGQILYAKVLDKCHGEKEEILLSLLPSDINSEIDETMLAEGSVLLCAIQEIEDHGYFLETGISNVRAFLPKKNMKTEPNIGELIFCKVHKLSKSVITFSAFKKNEPIKSSTVDVPNMKTLMPGTVVAFNVVQVLKNGLEGLLFDGSITAFVNEMYVPTKLSDDPNLIGKQVNARILYIMPLSNQLYVTLNTNDRPRESRKFIHFGTIVEKAKVVKQTSAGVLFQLGQKNERGFLPRRTIAKNFKNNFDMDSAMLKFSPNSMHTLRVMDYNEFENCYLCTNQARLLSEKFFGTYDMHIGQIVQAKVEEKLQSGGLRLSIGNVRAFLKGVFYHKVGKCDEGTEIRVRIAEIDHDAKLVQATNVGAFLKDGCKILDSKAKMKLNESYTGVVLKENPNSYKILFFNHLKGFLPKTEENQAALLSVGGLKEGSAKLFEIVSVKGDNITLRIPKKIEMHNIGKVFQCKVTAVLPGNGVQVYINELKAYGRVPINYLSESLTLNEHLLSVITEGSRMEVVALGNNEYSRRDVKYYRGDVKTDFNAICPDDTLRCFVKASDTANVELECPLKNFKETIRLNKNAFDEPDNVVLASGEIVYVNVIAKNESRSNSLYVTPALHKVWNSNDDALDMLENYLSDISFLLGRFKETKKPIGNYTVGQRVDGTVKNIIGNNVLMEVEEGVFAQATVENVRNCKVECQVKDAVVIWIDPVHQMLYLNTNEKCKDEISIEQEASESAVSEKKLKAIVLFSNDYVTVCSIRGSKASSLIYVPTKRHYNDFSGSSRALGNANSKLVIKRSSNGRLLGIFVQDSKVFQKLEKLKTKLSDKVVKRKATNESISESDAGDDIENKRPKVILEDSDDEGEMEQQQQEEEEAKQEEPEIEINSAGDVKKKQQQKKKKDGLDKKEKVKKVVETIQNVVKNSVKLTKSKKGFANKDSLLDENIVSLTSYQKLNEESKVSASIGKKKHVKVMKKSTIGKKKSPKRLIKKK